MLQSSSGKPVRGTVIRTIADGEPDTGFTEAYEVVDPRGKLIGLVDLDIATRKQKGRGYRKEFDFVPEWTEPTPEKSPNMVLINKINTNGDVKCKGIGTALCLIAMEVARAKGEGRLYIEHANYNSHSALSVLGFQPVHHDQNRVAKAKNAISQAHHSMLQGGTPNTSQLMSISMYLPRETLREKLAQATPILTQS